ncbi:hypothetical protein ES703_41078 [subsurface metagenome]
MARLTALPSIDIIRGFKGTLDFYLWRGLPCVRKWPHSRGKRRTAAEIASANLFGAIIKAYSLLGEGALQAYRESALDNPRTARDIYVSGVLGHLHERTEPPPPPPPEEEMYDAYVCLRDLKPQGTDGGTFSTGAWVTRDLNDEQADPQEICALAANQFILAAGTYRALITCPAFRVNRHKARLYNVTAAALLLLGTNEHSQTAAYTATRSHIAGRFTVEADQVLQIQHRCQTSNADDGFGRDCNYDQELYTIAEFWREIEEE